MWITGPFFSFQSFSFLTLVLDGYWSSIVLNYHMRFLIQARVQLSKSQWKLHKNYEVTNGRVDSQNKPMKELMWNGDPMVWLIGDKLELCNVSSKIWSSMGKQFKISNVTRWILKNHCKYNLDNSNLMKKSAQYSMLIWNSPNLNIKFIKS